MRLNAPKKIVFYIALGLMALGVVFFYGDFFSGSTHIGFWSSTFGGLLLAAGSYFKGF